MISLLSRFSRTCTYHTLAVAQCTTLYPESPRTLAQSVCDTTHTPKAQGATARTRGQAPLPAPGASPSYTAPAPTGTGLRLSHRGQRAGPRTSPPPASACTPLAPLAAPPVHPVHGSTRTRRPRAHTGTHGARRHCARSPQCARRSPPSARAPLRGRPARRRSVLPMPRLPEKRCLGFLMWMWRSLSLARPILLSRNCFCLA